MSINLLKRLESSVYSFNLTLSRILSLIKSTIKSIDDYERYGGSVIDAYEVTENEFDIDDSNNDIFTVGRKVKIDLADMDYRTWRTELQQDADTLELLTLMIADITPEHDSKLQTLLQLLDDKMKHPVNPGNRKVLIFSAFSDTAEYLYDQISKYMKNKYGLNTAVITGTIDGRTTVKGLKATLNNVLTCFSPVSKSRDVLMPGSTTEIDVLIATDCISEGQNLQDCDYLVNYDIHWNPVRIIQRFGRIDRIGSRNLRNINESINIDNQNRIHPFYMVYIDIDGDVVCDYLNPKKLLDTVRLLCRGNSEPILTLCSQFNKETDDGRDMKEISQLLSDAINSIIDVKEESDIDSLFKKGGTSALMSEVSGLDDFELICFLVVK